MKSEQLPEILAAEQAGLFARTWLCVGREADIPAAGDFFTQEIAGDSVIVIRGSDDRVRAFFNVCRHRGSRLIDVAAGQGLANAVNQVGAAPSDLVAILEALKEAGALHAELIVI